MTQAQQAKDYSFQAEDIKKLRDRKGRLNASPDVCWIWQGALGGKGDYGIYTEYLGNGETKTHLAHRYVYELVNGPIPEGLELDHTCLVHACVNPSHTEPVTQEENNRRRRNTHCINGHELNEENLYRHPQSGNIHGCKKCRKEAYQRWAATKSRR